MIFSRNHPLIDSNLLEKDHTKFAINEGGYAETIKMRTIHIAICFFLSTAFTYAQPTLIYPNIDGLAKNGIGYQVLKLALKKSGNLYAVAIDKPTANQDRAAAMLESGKIDVMDTGVDNEFSTRFEPIYRPIDRGLLGWRIFIIHKNKEKEFGKIRDLGDLKKYIAGQGINWPDGAILKAAGIKVQFAPHVKNLIAMVEKERFDFLPLGVEEAYGFLRMYGNNSPNLIVERSIVLVYPFGNFFYIRKNNPALKAAIEKGMDAALKDGSLQKLLESHVMFSDAFGIANIKNRKIIKIGNPYLPDGFKKINPAWWYYPIY